MISQKIDDKPQVKPFALQIKTTKKALMPVLETLQRVSNKVVLYIDPHNAVIIKAMNETFSAMINVELRKEFFLDSAFSPMPHIKFDVSDLKRVLFNTKPKERKLDVEVVLHITDVVFTVKTYNTELDGEFSIPYMIYEYDPINSYDNDPYQIDIYALGLQQQCALAPNTYNAFLKQAKSVKDDIQMTFGTSAVNCLSVSEAKKETSLKLSLPYLKSAIDAERENISLVCRVNELAIGEKLLAIKKTALAFIFESEKPLLQVFELLSNDDYESVLAKIGIMIAPVACKDYYEDTSSSAASDESDDNDDSDDDDDDDDSSTESVTVKTITTTTQELTLAEVEKRITESEPQSNEVVQAQHDDTSGLLFAEESLPSTTDEYRYFNESYE